MALTKASESAGLTDNEIKDDMSVFMAAIYTRLGISLKD